MIILQRDTVERELFDLGYTDQFVLYGRSDRGFMNSSLFYNGLRDRFSQKFVSVVPG